jgi:WXG100 family type VII secretion target
MNHAEIHLTPEEIDNFAKTLEQFAEHLHGSTASLNDSLHQLGDTWRDQAFAEFEAHFSQTRKSIDEFVDVSAAYVKFLREKAELSRIAGNLKM